MSTIIGVFGAVCVVVAYFLLQIEKIKPNTYSYNFLNLMGGILLTISLIYNFNLGSLIIEIMWIGIALYGIFKVRRQRSINAN